MDTIDEAAKTGLHATERGRLKVVGRFEPKKVRFYRDRVLSLFGQDALIGKDISWLDIGAGYGELVQAVGGLVANQTESLVSSPACQSSRARRRGLDVRNWSMGELDATFDVVSMINVFSTCRTRAASSDRWLSWCLPGAH